MANDQSNSNISPSVTEKIEFIKGIKESLDGYYQKKTNAPELIKLERLVNAAFENATAVEAKIEGSPRKKRRFNRQHRALLESVGRKSNLNPTTHDVAELVGQMKCRREQVVRWFQRKRREAKQPIGEKINTKFNRI